MFCFCPAYPPSKRGFVEIAMHAESCSLNNAEETGSNSRTQIRLDRPLQDIMLDDSVRGDFIFHQSLRYCRIVATPNLARASTGWVRALMKLEP